MSSWADVTKKNADTEHMPEPDQGLLDGHFAGETETGLVDVDHKITVIPAGSDLNHPPVSHANKSHIPAAQPITRAEVEEPHVSEVAPDPTPAPPKSEIHIPQSGEEAEKKAKEVKAKADKKANEVKKTAGEAAEKVKAEANKAGNEAAKTADKVGKEASKAADKFGKEASKAAETAEKKTEEFARKAKAEAKELGKQAKAEFREAESAAAQYYEKAKDVVLRPHVLGGIFGVVNLGIIAGLGYAAYINKDKRVWDKRIVGGALAGTLALFGAEGYVAEQHLETPEGQEEARRAKEEGSKFYLATKERVLRPGVAGGLVGALNVALLSTVGYFSYQNWNRRWDPRTVSAVGAGLVTLSGLEGYLGKTYVDKELPKH